MGVFRLGAAAEAPQDHIMVRAMLGVPYDYVLKHTVLCTKNIVCPGLHILSLVAHAPHPPIPRPGFAVQEEVRRRIFDILM